MKERSTVLSRLSLVASLILAFTAVACSVQLAQPLPSSEPAQTVAAPPAEPSAADRAAAVPDAYTAHCAKCHGVSGEGKQEGKKKYPPVDDVTTRDEDQLTPDAVTAVIDDASAQGLSSKMPAFKDKLSQEQKQQIVDWIVALGASRAEAQQ